MDSLRAYESPRGLAYLLIVSSAFGPATAALYSLAPDQFNSLDWPKLMLLVGSAGGMALLLSQLSFFFFDLGAEKEKGTHTMRTWQIMMGIASGYALTVQLIVLAATSYLGVSFRTYFHTTLWVFGSVALAVVIYSMSRSGNSVSGR